MPVNDKLHIVDITAPRKLSLQERFWLWLGFGDVLQPEFQPEEFPDIPEGHHIIMVMARIKFIARVRLLVSGKLVMRISLKTDPKIERSISRAQLGVLPPSAKV